MTQKVQTGQEERVLLKLDMKSFSFIKWNLCIERSLGHISTGHYEDLEQIAAQEGGFSFVYAKLVTKIPVLSIPNNCVSTNRMYSKLSYG